MTDEAKSRPVECSGDGPRRVGSGGADGPLQLVRSLKETVAKLKRQVSDQKERIEALARGREDGMAAVSKLRSELALVTSERDRLRQQLTALEGMQTETIAFDDESGDTGVHLGHPPSIDELISSFSGENQALPRSHSTMTVDSAAGGSSNEYQEMISPELLVLGSASEKEAGVAERCLLLLEEDKQTKCQLNEDLLTIGRSESADIKVDGDFISRIHARILRIGMDTIIEDAGSMNGTWVGEEQIRRHTLKHGELIRIGSASFRFIDIGSGRDEAD